MQCSVGKTTSHLVALAPLETSRLPSEPHRSSPYASRSFMRFLHVHASLDVALRRQALPS